MKWPLAAALMLMLTSSAHAGDIHDACVHPAVCAENPKLAGPCFEMRGVLRLRNGNPTFRIWRSGTKRILGVLCDEDPFIPSNLKEWLGDPSNAQWDRDFRGTYEVCPFTKSKPGVMQFVCIEKVTNLTVYDRTKKRVLKENEKPAVR